MKQQEHTIQFGNPTAKFQRRACHVTFIVCHIPIGSMIHAQKTKGKTLLFY